MGGSGRREGIYSTCSLSLVGTSKCCSCPIRLHGKPSVQRDFFAARSVSAEVQKPRQDCTILYAGKDCHSSPANM